MSDLKKWLETVSNESAEHSADIETQAQLKEDESSVEVGDNEKLSDDPSRAESEEESEEAVEAAVDETVEEVAETTETDVEEPGAETEPTEGEPAAFADIYEGQVELPPVDGEEVVSEEGFLGGLAGFILGGVGWVAGGGAVVGAGAKASIQKTKEDIKEISERIAKLRNGQIDEVVKKGTKLPKSIKKVDAADIVKGAVIGLFFGPLYGAYKGSQMENEYKKLQDKIEQLKDEMKKAGVSVEDFMEPTEELEAIEGEVNDQPEAVEGDEPPLVEVDPVAEITDGEEPTPVEGSDEEDESFEDFDGVADAHITDDMDGVEQDIDDMDNMQTALEAYGELLAEEMDKKNGVVDPTLVRAIQIGLESFGEPVLTQDVPSLEDFADPAGRYVVSLEFAEGLKDKAGKVAKATMAAIQRLWELLEDIFRQFKANVPALKQKNEELAEKLKNTVDAGKGTVSMKGARRLYIGDMFAGNNPNNIKTVYQVGDKFMVLYPKMFRAITMDYSLFAKQIENANVEGLDIFGFITSTAKHFVPADLGMQKIDGSKVPSTMQKHTTHTASPVLLGNRRFFAGISMNVKGVEASGDPVKASLDDIFKLEFGHEQGVADSGSDDTIKLPDVATLRQLANETATLTKHLEKYSEATGNFRQIRREMESTTQTTKLAAVAQGISRAITVPTGHFVGYVSNLVRVLQAFIEYCINEHRAAATEV